MGKRHKEPSFVCFFQLHYGHATRHQAHVRSHHHSACLVCRLWRVPFSLATHCAAGSSGLRPILEPSSHTHRNSRGWLASKMTMTTDMRTIYSIRQPVASQLAERDVFFDMAFKSCNRAETTSLERRICSFCVVLFQR